MVHPKGCGRLGQATLDTILECPACAFYLPIGLTVANGDVVIDDAQPFTELCKAAHKFSSIVGPDVAWLAPMGNQVFVQELGRPPTLQQEHGMDLHPLGEWIHGDKEVKICVFIPWKWTYHVDAPVDKWCATFVHLM